jgi:hypothetical protein
MDGRAMEKGGADVTAEKKKKRRRRKPNPTVLVLGNPPVKGELFGDDVVKLEYHHVDDAGDILRFHDFGPGVRMYALENGHILLVHSNKDRPLWAHH